MKTEDKTCRERISESFQNRCELLEEIYDKLDDCDNLEDQDEAREEYNELALEITEYRIIKVLLSTGGPADWLEIKLDDDNDVINVEYHFSDWFDHASMRVDSSSYLWQYALEIVESY